MAIIVPSILVKTETEFQEKLALVEGHTDRIHLDIGDGIFVDNLTIDGITELEDLETNLAITVHLMVSKPENHVVRWVESQVDEISFHIESTNQAQRVVDVIKEADMKVGIALNPGTETDSIADLIDQIDFIHFMTVEPGFYGGKFIESIVEKIKDFHFYYPDMAIRADGSVTPATAPKLVEAGASTLVSGSFIFGSEDVEIAINKLKESI